MLCFADNDIIFKLGEFDLFDEALNALNTEKSSVRVLSSVQYVVRRKLTTWGKKPTPQHTKAGLQRALDFVSSITALSEQPDSNEHQILVETDGIDDGEAVLLASTKGIANFLLATGDKRSLIALSRAPSCSTIFERVIGRVICLEQIILQMMSVAGFEHIRRHITSGTHCDAGLRMIFRPETPQLHLLEGLNSHIESLRRDSGGILVRLTNTDSHLDDAVGPSL